MNTQVIIATAAVIAVIVSIITAVISAILLSIKIKNNAGKNKAELIKFIERGDDRVLAGVKNIIDNHDTNNRVRFDSADKKIESVSADVREVRRSLDGFKNTLFDKMHFKPQE